MYNEANPAYHAWITLDAELQRRGIAGWLLALPPEPGAAFLAASLIPAFRAVHGKLSNRVNLVIDRSVAGMIDLFPAAVDQTLVHPDLSPGLLDDLTLFSRFRPGSLFVADPDRHGDGRLSSFLGCGGIVPLDLWRYVLHLPWSVEPVVPVVSAGTRDAAAARFEAAGLPRGRTCALMETGDDLERLAAGLRAEGWTPCVPRPPAGRGASDAPPSVAGLPVVELGWAELIPFCGIAGAVVAGRGGWCEVLGHADCRRVFIHRDAASLKAHVATPPWAGDGPVEVIAGEDTVAVTVAALAAAA